MQAIFLAVLSYFTWGGGDCFGTLASRRMGAGLATFWVLIIGCVLFSAYLPFVLDDLARYTAPLLLLNVVLGAVVLFGNVAFNEAAALINPSIAAAISGSFTAWVVVGSMVLYGERLTLLQGAAVVLVCSGILLCTVDLREARKGNVAMGAGIAWALAAMVSWSIYFTFLKMLVREVGWFWPQYLSFCLFPLMALYLALRRVPFRVPAGRSEWLPVLASALLLRTGDFSFNGGIAFGYTSIIAPIAGAYPTFLAVLGAVFFRDPVTRQQWLGIVAAVLGMIALGVLSV